MPVTGRSVGRTAAVTVGATVGRGIAVGLGVARLPPDPLPDPLPEPLPEDPGFRVGTAVGAGGGGCGRGRVVKERVGHRDGLAHVAHTVHRLHQQLLIGVRVLLEMDAQRAARQLRVGRAVDLYRGHAGLRVGGFDVQVFALDARLEGGTGVVDAVDRQALAVRLAIGVGHNDFYLAVFQQVDPDVAGGQRPVYERLSAHADAHGGPAVPPRSRTVISITARLRYQPEGASISIS